MGSRSCMIGVWTRTFFESLLFRRPPIKLYLSIQSFVLLQLAAWLGLCTRISPPTCSFLLFFHSAGGTPVVSIVAPMNDESSTLYHCTCLYLVHHTPGLYWLVTVWIFVRNNSNTCYNTYILCWTFRVYMLYLVCLLNNNLFRRILYAVELIFNMAGIRIGNSRHHTTAMLKPVAPHW